jgi:hypothetical protein
VEPAPAEARARHSQRLVLALGVSFAALAALVFDAASFAELLASGALAWLVVEVLARRTRGAAATATTPTASRALVALLVALALGVLFPRLGDLRERESFQGLGEHLGDRLRLERAVALHPPLVVDARPQRFYVHAEGANTVRVTLAPGVRALAAASLGHGLFRVDYDPRAHGAPTRGGEVDAMLEVDGATHTRAVQVVRALAHPRALHASPGGRRACTTSEETDEAFVVDAAGALVRWPTRDGPTDCAWLDASTLAITHRHDARVAFVSLADRSESTLAIGPGAQRLALSADGTRLAIALAAPSARVRGEVVLVDVPGRRIAARTALAGTPDFLAFAGDARTLVVAQRAPGALLRLTHEGDALHLAASRPLLAPATSFTALDGGARVLVAATDWSETGTSHLGNHFIQDQLLTVDARTLALVGQRFTATRSARQDAAGDVDRGLSPIGLSPKRDGDWLVAFAGSDELALVSPQGAPTRSFDVAALGLSAPHSVVALRGPDGPVLVATSPSSGFVAVLDAQTGAPRALHRLAPDDRALLRADPDALARRYGERAFYEGTRAGIACQSCHPHGGTDGMAHNIGGRVLAPTLPLFGLAGTSPYLRDGSYPRVADLLEVAEHRYRGYRESAGDRGATLDAWVRSLPLPAPYLAAAHAATGDSSPSPDAVSAAERRGLDAFVRAGCSSCHAFPAFTNLGRHAARSVFPRAHHAPGASLDTPSLRAVSHRERFLHDGRARSLASIFDEHDPDGRHGRARELDAVARADLVTFLESL